MTACCGPRSSNAYCRNAKSLTIAWLSIALHGNALNTLNQLSNFMFFSGTCWNQGIPRDIFGQIGRRQSRVRLCLPVQTSGLAMQSVFRIHENTNIFHRYWCPGVIHSQVSPEEQDRKIKLRKKSKENQKKKISIKNWIPRNETERAFVNPLPRVIHSFLVWLQGQRWSRWRCQVRQVFFGSLGVATCEVQSPLSTHWACFRGWDVGLPAAKGCNKMLLLSVSKVRSARHQVHQVNMVFGRLCHRRSGPCSLGSMVLLWMF